MGQGAWGPIRQLAERRQTSGEGARCLEHGAWSKETPKGTERKEIVRQLADIFSEETDSA